MLQAEDLKRAFPWLGTDEEVDGADVVDQINDDYEAALKQEKQQKRLRKKYLRWAKDQNQEGHLEVDEKPVVSKGGRGSGGAYVACWMWVSDDEAKEANQRAAENEWRRANP